MLRNFVTTTDLKIRYPKIDKQLWTEQVDYQPQINKGFDRLMNDLHNLNINARQVMIPLDLFAPLEQTSNQEVVQQTFNGIVAFEGVPKGGTFQPLVGWGQYGLPYVSGPGQFVQEYYQNIYINLNQRRLVTVNWGNISGSLILSLQGNNVQTSPTNTGVPADNDPNWRTITTQSFDSTTTIGEETEIFYNQYRWYRVQATGSTQAIVSAYTVENIFDEAICNAAFVYIFRDFVKEDGDQWHIRLKNAEEDYQQALRNMHFLFDLNDDGITTTDDEEKRVGTIVFVR